MKVFVSSNYLSSSPFFFLLLLLVLPVSLSARTPNGTQLRANTPPRGWNSYDSFCWTISEHEFLQNAETVSRRLKTHGYEYVVVDYLWYRKKVPGAYVDSLGYDVIDEWGRMMPDPGRWPSSAGGKGFSEVANKVHRMGLKFGIHVMRGISTQAVNANTLILDTDTGGAYAESGKTWRAQDIALKERACAWMTHGFMSVDTTLGAGRAFLRSLYKQYAEWGVDFVKHDCVFGDDLDVNEITFVSHVLQQLDRPILYSLSPGTRVTPTMAKQISGLVNMYRITGDDWDNWGDVAAHFDVSRDMSSAGLIGGKSWSGKSWPDLDMLPLGWLTDPDKYGSKSSLITREQIQKEMKNAASYLSVKDEQSSFKGSNDGPHRSSRLSLHEQRTQMTLWGFAKSPLMFGGDLRKLDDRTFRLITNPTLLEINSFSSKNEEFPFVTASTAVEAESHSGRLRTLPAAVTLSEMEVLGLTSCKEPKTNGWSVNVVDRDLEKICWKAENQGSKEQPICLYKRDSLLISDEEIIFDGPHQGKLQLLASRSVDICLDASPKRRITAQEFKRATFSRCRWEANQMWELHGNGSLVNSYSRQCAIVRTIKRPGGVRSWVATGRQGEIYLALFNLNQHRTTISAQLSDIGKVLLFNGLSNATCKYKEAWSNRDMGTTAQTVSYTVEGHGAALFVLRCSIDWANEK